MPSPSNYRTHCPLRFMTNTRRFDFRIDVSIDEEGRPDAFAPARLNGVPVRGTYRMTLKSR